MYSLRPRRPLGLLCHRLPFFLGYLRLDSFFSSWHRNVTWTIGFLTLELCFHFIDDSFNEPFTLLLGHSWHICRYEMDDDFRDYLCRNKLLAYVSLWTHILIMTMNFDLLHISLSQLPSRGKCEIKARREKVRRLRSSLKGVRTCVTTRNRMS